MKISKEIFEEGGDAVDSLCICGGENERQYSIQAQTNNL